MMENTFAKVEELVEHMKEYVNNRLDALKLSAAEKASKIMSGFVVRIILLLISFLFIMFGGFSLAFALGELTGKLYWGFLIVAGLFLLMGIIIWFGRNKLIRLPIMNALLQQLYSGEENGKD